MNETTLSVFVDESGNFSCQDESSRFYIVTLVLHRQSDSIAELVQTFDDCLARLNLNNLCFHAGPIIRREDGYAYMNWELRSHIFSLMMAFLRKAPVKYASIVIDKKYVASPKQLSEQLVSGFIEVFDAVRRSDLGSYPVKIYYDCGQAPVTVLLQKSATSVFGTSVQIAQGVRPVDYKLFQLADLICTLTLVAHKIDAGIPLSSSEEKFFGGARAFKRQYFRQLRAKRFMP